MNRHIKAIIVLLLTGTILIPLGAQSFPDPVGYVNDFAGIVDSRDESKIEAIAVAIEKATSIEVAVVTVASMAPYTSIEDFSIDLASEWQIGKKGEDNGMLLVVALKERETRIEVGYGLEGVFPDGLVGRIMDASMIPYFKNNDFSTGLAKAVDGIAGVISKEYDVDLSHVSTNESAKYESSGTGGSPSLYPFLSLIFILFIGGGRFLWPLIFLGGMGRRGRYTRGGFGVSSRGGFGSRGGGFSGFGGGSFGGGGASRSF